MRLKAETVLEFGLDEGRRDTRIVREYREEYKRIGQMGCG
jgi:hypothetical protein